jgi:hypothetical protein
MMPGMNRFEFVAWSHKQAVSRSASIAIITATESAERTVGPLLAGYVE